MTPFRVVDEINQGGCCAALCVGCLAQRQPALVAVRSAGTSERQQPSMCRRFPRLPFPGMDPINERKVFMQLVEAACRWGWLLH